MQVEFEDAPIDKLKLELAITSLIAEFEERYSHKIEIDSIKLDRMRLIGPHKALCRLTIRITD
jgi:hypothetical protein